MQVEGTLPETMIDQRNHSQMSTIRIFDVQADSGKSLYIFLVRIHVCYVIHLRFIKKKYSALSNIIYDMITTNQAPI